jgi:hypothetical protein
MLRPDPPDARSACCIAPGPGGLTASQPRLSNQLRGHAVDILLVYTPASSCPAFFAQQCTGLRRGQSFVYGIYGQTITVAYPLGEIHRPGTHFGCFTGAIIGHANDNDLRPPFVDERLDFRPGVRLISGLDCFQSSNCVRDAICKCDTYSTLAEIENEGRCLVSVALVDIYRAPSSPWAPHSRVAGIGAESRQIYAE